MNRKLKWTALLMTLLTVFILTGCSGQKALSDKAADELAQTVIDEFTALCEVPRPSGYNEKILPYLCAWCESKGLEYQTDTTGNIWWDLPASEGYENYPGIILQAHYDMVCVAEEGKTVDFENTGITPVISGNIMAADGTSLGADDGVGVAAVLAVSESDQPHGPLRIILTKDEETTMEGAMNLSAETLNGDFLINIDNELVDEICYSSAGTATEYLTKECETINAAENSTGITLSISGLLGGHSGINVNAGRLSAVKALSEILYELETEGISPQLQSFDAGKIVNAIANCGTVVFAVPEEQSENARSIMDAVVKKLGEEYPQETIIADISVSPLTSVQSQFFCTAEDSGEFIELLQALPQDVITLSSKTENFPQTSNNIGIAALKDGQMDILCATRSCVMEDLRAQGNNYQLLAENNGFTYTKLSESPSYDGDPDSVLSKLAQEGLKTAGIDVDIVPTHGGMEWGFFDEKKPGMTMICMGATISEEHSVKETLDLSTVEPMMRALYYIFEHIGEENQL